MWSELSSQVSSRVKRGINMPEIRWLGFLLIVVSYAMNPSSAQGKQNKGTAGRDGGPASGSNVERALSFKPIQKDVVYDQPTAEEIKNCRIEPADKIGQKGFLVYDGSGRLLRAYLDTNNDGKPDLWCYYKDGIEVYRDIDSNFDEKADQYRWLGTAGSRWAEDKNQDGQIDRWLAISPEEVTMELVAAIRDRDIKRFELLLLSEADLKTLGMGTDFESEVLKRIRNAKNEFSKFIASQRLIDTKTTWVHFGGIKPGVIPANSLGSTKDVMVYDNVQAVVNTGTKHGQLAVGTLVKLNDAWKIIDLPEVITEGVAISNGGVFFNASLSSASTVAGSDATGAVDSVSQELFNLYASMEEKIGKASGRELEQLHQDRAEVLLKLSAAASTAEDRSNWIRQMADDVSGAYQNGQFPRGIDYLKDVAAKLEKDKADEQDVAHVQYRRMAAFFTKQLTSAEPDDFLEVEKQYNAALEAYITRYPKAQHAPDAMLQLALAAEFKEEIDQASEWYGKIATEYPKSPLAKKAAGAKVRLNCEGQAITFRGKTVRGDNWSLADERGSVVLIHFWATWCEPCKDDINTIKRIAAKYADSNFKVVGVSVDDSISNVQSFLRSETISWTQLYEEGGMDGPLADQLGIATLPTMLLIGKDGKVIDRNIASNALERSVQRAIRD